MLALLGYLRDPVHGPDEVRRQCPTYSEWAKPSDANPITYDALTPDLLRYLRNTGALFARKFRADMVSADHWDEVVREAARQAEAAEPRGEGAGSSSSSSGSGKSSAPSTGTVAVQRDELKSDEVFVDDAKDISTEKNSKRGIDEPATKRQKAL
jgi:hypothetical protein